MKKTLVLGASPKPYRYSHVATLRLQQAGIEVVPVGINQGTIGGLDILDLRKKPSISKLHTVTVYLSPEHQVSWYQYILNLHPKRLIFNPGSENPEFYQKLDTSDIFYEEACTLVMLANHSY